MAVRTGSREPRCAARTVKSHLSNIDTKQDIGGPGARIRLSNLVKDAGLVDSAPLDGTRRDAIFPHGHGKTAAEHTA